MWSRSHPPTPGQQPSFVCFWDPRGVDRALQRKLGHRFEDQAVAGSSDYSTKTFTDESTATGSRLSKTTFVDFQEHAETTNRRSSNEVSSNHSKGGKSSESSPDSPKTSDKSSLSGPSWRMRREVADFRIAANEVGNARKGSFSAGKEVEHDSSPDTDIYTSEDSEEKDTKPLVDHDPGLDLLDAKVSADKVTSMNCKEQATLSHGRRLGQPFIRTSTQGTQSSALASFVNAKCEKNDYFDDADFTALPSDSRAISQTDLGTYAARQCSAEPKDMIEPVDFGESIFDSDILIGNRPEYTRSVSSALLQRLRRELKSEETEPFLRQRGSGVRAPNIRNVNNVSTSDLSGTKHSWKPQFFRAPASAPVIKTRRTETASATDIPQDNIGRNRRAWQNTLCSSEESNLSVNNSDDINPGSPPRIKEGVLRKHWSLGFRNPLRIPVYLGTSRRSRLMGKSSPSLSPDDRDVHYSSGSRSTSELATPDPEQALAIEACVNSTTTNDCFRVRSSRLTYEDDDSDEERRNGCADIPDHLPSSPLCPLNPKYRGDRTIECPQHRRRRLASSVPT